MKAVLKCMLWAMIAMLSSCGGKSQTETAADDQTDGQVQVLYLHGTQRCRACVAVGSYSQEVVSNLADSNVVWKEIDLSTPQGELTGDKYQIAGSGLVVVNGNRWENLTGMAFRYALTDTLKFKNDLEAKIREYLN